jgi:uncharacterized protein
MLEIIGYIASIFIGITLGLVGSGGSILTVPVLVYLFGMEPVIATACSMCVVGATSAVGSVAYFRKGLVNLNMVLLFGIPSVIAVVSTRLFIVPLIPLEVCTIGDFIITKNNLLMLLFSILMILASYNMIQTSAPNITSDDEDFKFNPMIVLRGLMVGAVTGLIGAGGGFLIIPALVFLCRLPMKEAVGTSLVIIMFNTLIGFLSVFSIININWTILFPVMIFAITGMFIGLAMSKKIDGAKLKPAFGWFILVMGVYIILREIFIK